jgi:hypothetical protein
MRRVLKAGAVLALGVMLITGLALIGLYEVSQSPDYCRWCHVMEPYVSSWESSEFLAHDHYLADITCQTCHPQTMADLLHEIVATVRESYFVPLPELQFSQEECLGCHGDYTDLASATEHLDHNPHESHLGNEECYQCHKVHRKSPGMKFCVNCHHTGDFVVCSECHNDR